MTTQQFTTTSYEDVLSRLKVRYVQVLAAVATLAAGLGLVAQVVTGAQNGTLSAFPIAITAAFVVINIGLLILVQEKRISVAAVVLVSSYVLASLFTPLPAFILVAILVVISAATLSSRSVYALANLAVLGKLAFDTFQILRDSGGVFTPDLSANLVILMSLVMLSITARYFINTAQLAAQNAQRGSNLLQATASIGQITASLLELDKLLPQAVELIRDRFAFYHVQVFLVNETRDQAVLVASTGEAGQQLLERQHRLAVGSKSIIGQVTQSGEPAIARDTDQDALHFRNELLPNTRSELAVPMIEGNTIIGALDVQSTRPDAFQPSDMQALQTLANQLATAVRNARLFEQRARSAQENKRFFLEAEANLREIQRLNQQLTKTGWSDYLGEHRSSTGVTMEGDQVISDAAWTESLIRATEGREAVSRSHDAGQVIAVPVMLRGEVIGAIEVEPGGGLAENEAVEMAQAIAQRLAVSLDNARLFEEAQAATAQEQRINAIVSQYQSLTSVDDLLRTTLAELSQTLGAQRGAIRLGSVQRERVNGGSAS